MDWWSESMSASVGGGGRFAEREWLTVLAIGPCPLLMCVVSLCS